MSDTMGALERLAIGGDYLDAYDRGVKVGRAQALEELAQWMIANSFATGHGDTTKNLLGELLWQIEERVKLGRAP